VNLQDINIDNCFLNEKIAVLKIRTTQKKDQQNHHCINVLSLIQNRPSWYLHTLLRCYSIPYHCYNSSSLTALGYQLPILIDSNDILSVCSTEKQNVFQTIENEMILLRYIQTKFNLSSDDGLPTSNYFTSEFNYINNSQHYWLNYIHVSLNCALDELKSLIKFNSTESNVVDTGSINGYLNLIMRTSGESIDMFGIFRPAKDKRDGNRYSSMYSITIYILLFSFINFV
jgi:hypothetical protein